MPADVDLVNRALLLVGAAPITALTESSLSARIATACFADVRDALQTEWEWNFNQFRSSTLTQEATTPSFGWSYRFALPNDPYCLRVLAMSEEDSYSWVVEARYLLTDYNAPKLRYLGRVTDIGVWSAGFKRAFPYHLAHAMAYPLTHSINVARDMTQLAQVETRQARAIDGLETAPTTLRSQTLTDVRY
jgi:hypothetical protein